MAKTIEIIIGAKDNASKVFKSVAASVRGMGRETAAAIADMGKNAIAFTASQFMTAGIDKAFTQIKSAVIDYNDELKKSEIAFTTMFKGSKEAAREFMAELDRFNTRTPFQTQDINQLSMLLLNAGWAARDVIPTMTALGNATAASGKGAEGLQRIVLALSQIKAKGRVQGEEMLQLLEAGVPAAEILAQKLGLTAEQMKNIGNAGVEADAAIKALIEGINERYGGLMEKLNDTLSSQMSTMSDNFNSIFASIGEPLYNELVNMTKEINDWAGEIKTTIKESGVQKAFEELIPEEFQKRIEETYNTIYDLGESLVSLAKDLTGTESAAGAFLAAVDACNAGIRAMIAVAQEAYSAIASLSAQLGSFFAAAEQQIANQQGLIGQAAEMLKSARDTSWNPLAAASQALGEMVGMSESANSNSTNFENQKLNYQNAQKALKGGLEPNTGSRGKAKTASSGFDFTTITNAVTSGVQKVKDTYNSAYKQLYESDNHFKNYLNSFYVPTAADKKKGVDVLNAHKGSVAPKSSPKISGGGGGGGSKRGGKKSGGGSSAAASTEDVIGGISQAELDRQEELSRELIERQRQTMEELRSETTIANAKLLGDKKSMADAEYQVSLGRLDREREARIKDLEQTQTDAESKLTVDQWYDSQKKLLEQQHADELRESRIEEYDNLIEFNQLEVELRTKTQEEVNRLNRDVFDKKIAFLKEELANESLTVEEIIELRKELADVQNQRMNSPVSAGEAFSSGLQQEAQSWGDFFTNIKNVGQETARAMQGAFQEFFFDAMTGQLKDLGDYVNSFLKGVARAISNALANAFAQKLITGLFGGGLMGMASGGMVTSGTPYIVGEKGPELFVPSASGSIIPNHSLPTSTAAASGAPNVVVNVHNNTGVQAEVRQETKFDGQRYIVGVFMDAYAKNIGGLRTVMAGARG